jgi:DNA repair protein RadC
VIGASGSSSTRSMLTEALRLIDVRVLDHLIIGAAQEYSFAETGRL